MTVLLLDGDIVAYKMSSAVEKPIEWGDGIWTLQANVEEAKEAVKGYVSSLMKNLEATKIWLCFSDTENFRKKVYPEYKANRKDVRKPLVYSPLVEWMKEFYPSKVFEGVEADDVLGIVATIHAADKPVIVSEDKDLKQIPGYIYNPKKDVRPRLITEEEADHNFYIQLLAGDVTDNYKGCPGIGAETAEEFLKKPYVCEEVEKVLKSGKRKGQTIKQWKQRPLKEGETLWTAIVSLFTRAGLTEADALVQARVARILRSSDYDAKKMKVKLWEPEKCTSKNPTRVLTTTASSDRPSVKPGDNISTVSSSDAAEKHSATG